MLQGMIILNGSLSIDSSACLLLSEIRVFTRSLTWFPYFFVVEQILLNATAVWLGWSETTGTCCPSSTEPSVPTRPVSSSWILADLANASSHCCIKSCRQQPGIVLHFNKEKKDKTKCKTRFLGFVWLIPAILFLTWCTWSSIRWWLNGQKYIIFCVL
jgi:hypothetical protein